MGLFLFIVGCVLALLGLLAFFGGLIFGQSAQSAQHDNYGHRVRERQPSTRAGGVLVGLLLVLVGGAVILMDSFTTIAARGVAVQTSFGKVRGDTLGPGFHWVSPWNNVEEFDASVQTLKFYKDEKDDDGTCVTVRLGNNTPACVDVTTQWNINHRGDVKNLYLSYKTFENIHDNLVKRQLGSALNEVFGTYDPLVAIGKNTDTPTVNTKQLQEQVKRALQDDLGTGVLIDSVTIPIVHFDVDTENRLRAFQQSKANTRIAEQDELTAAAQARANKALADQVSVLNPGVMYQNCLNLVDRLGQKGQLQHLPPTFNCNQGSAPGAIIQAK